MNPHIQTYARVKMPLLVFVLLTTLLVSCGTVEPTSTPEPTAPLEVAGTGAAEPQSEQESDLILLPSVTLGPTATPGVITELVEQFTETTGLQQTTFVGINIENWLNLGASILLIFVFGFLLSRLVIWILEKFAARTETKYDDIFIWSIRRPVFVIFVVFGLQIGTLRLPFIEAITKHWFNQIYLALYVIMATIILWRLLDVVVEWYQTEVEPERENRQVDTVLLLLQRGARTLLVIISLIMLLSLYNINVNALITALGVGGLAISLAAQDTLSNVISGIMIMIDQPFRVGDRIEIQGLGTWGDVVDIGLRSTRIRTRDNRMVIVPNNSISRDQIVNYTYPDPQYRVQIDIGIAYGTDIEHVRKIIIDTVRNVDGVLDDKPVEALYHEMGDSAMIFRVRWWIESFTDLRRAFDWVNTALQNALDAAGILMPSPRQDLNVTIIEEETKTSKPENRPEK